jgi:hypothetical protein
MPTNREMYEPIAREAARRYGIDEETFVRQIAQESGFNPLAHNVASGASGIAQIIGRFHPGVNPADPIASLEYAAKWVADLRRIYGSYRKALASFNWGPANVAKWDGKRETLPEETRHYLDVILGDGWPEPAQILSAEKRNPPLRVSEDGVRLRSGPGTDTAILATLRAGAEVQPLTDHAWRQVRVGDQTGWVAADYLDASGFGTASEQQTVQSARVFDPTTPDEKQRQSWTCAIRSVMWLLKSIGISVSPEEAQDAMSPRYVTSDVGLLDASGAGIVKVLADRWGVTARNLPSASFDDVMQLAGKQPVAIGGRNWGGPGLGHWSAVRGVDGDRLALANPAAGQRFGQTTLSRNDWARIGPFSAVVVNLEA